MLLLLTIPSEMTDKLYYSSGSLQKHGSEFVTLECDDSGRQALNHRKTLNTVASEVDTVPLDGGTTRYCACVFKRVNKRH